MEHHRPPPQHHRPPPQQQQQQQQYALNMVLQSMGLIPNNNFNLPFQQNSNFPLPNNSFQFNQNLIHGGFPPPNNSFQFNHGGFPPPNLQPPASSHQHKPNPQPRSESITKRTNHKPPIHDSSIPTADRKQTLDNIQAAVATARREAIDSGDHVSVFKVSQRVLAILQAQSWESTGFQLLEVPSLHQLSAVESKVNAFIRCHVAAHKITTLYDLQEALCKNEGVDKYEDLELGPLLQQPLVRHYFSLTEDMVQVYKITTEEVVSHLSNYLYKKRDVVIDEFLDFIAKKYKVANHRVLGLRIHSLGMYVSCLNKAQTAQHVVLKKAMKVAEEKSVKRKKKRPLFSLQKKELDDRFSSLSERVKSFASANKGFCGKHIVFVSSSSDEFDDMTDSSDDENIKKDSLTGNQGQLSSLKGQNGDRVSSCPYPSVAEEMTRLGLKGENGENSSPCTQTIETKKRNKKRKHKSLLSGSMELEEETTKLGLKGEIGENSSPCTQTIETKRRRQQRKSQRKKRKLKNLPRGSTDSEEDNNNNSDNDVIHDSIRMFITTWKEVCRGHSASQVLEKMLIFYRIHGKRQRDKLRKRFSAYPFLGLLNVAVISIRKGMWDSMYDTFQFIGELGQADTQANKLEEYENIDVEPLDNNPESTSKHDICVNAEDIMRKVSDYFTQDNVIYGGTHFVDRLLMLAKRLSLCEVWLAEQFSVNDFKSLGQGDFYSFLIRNSGLLPNKLSNYVRGESQKHHSLDVSMVQQQLVALLSQASSSLWEEDVVTKDKIVELLKKQFPFLSFAIVENDSVQEVLDFVKKQRVAVASNCVIYSATLVGTSKYVDSAGFRVSDMLSDSQLEDTNNIGDSIGLITSRDAIDNLLKAPFLSDLSSWSHWDLVYSPSLGSLLEWLLTEVNVEGLLCLVTRDGKIIRIDHSASVDLFSQALLLESPFQMAVQLLSLFAVSGGKKHVPLSLLKCQAQQGFKVIMDKYLQNMDSDDGRRSEKRLRGNEPVGNFSSTSLIRNLNAENNAVVLVSRIVMDSLVLLPSEFRCFAADVLLSGLQSLVKDVASTLLFHCKGNEERIMLHEIGLSMGILEWVNDHNSVCPMTDSNSLISTEAQSLLSMGSNLKGFESSHYTASGMTSVYKVDRYRNNTDAFISVGVSEKECSEHDLHRLAEEDIKEAALVVESIRRDEFGLDPNISDVESSLLRKQHARLGRALHCLSEELYSQDSHFLLELVQNADDNVYPANVEPTLSFIVLETGIIILNNERGFSAKNVRALCDVGNSTKKGSSAGYIGQKGIGFKSVFRVTDAPEIHSNGFHIKFDISQGQIGFVLPTCIPPYDAEMLKRLVPGDDSHEGINIWNTCIVLPFKSKLLEGSAMGSILSMFSDLHPSLLLFLHRLRCIKLRNMLDDSLIVMRKEVVGDGIVKVSHGKEQMTWFVASNRLQPKVARSNVHMTEISIALTLNESLNGDYEPFLIQQPVFAFLPLRTYGLKFILQADFVLPSSREEVDGNSPWNQWLLSEFPVLFVNAEKLFCSLPCFQGNPAKAVSAYMSFVPLMGEVHGFFSALPRMIIAKLRQSNCLLKDGCEDKWIPPCKVLRGWNEQAHMLLPDTLLYEHLGLVFLHKEVNLSDPLAMALGIENYGPKILVQFISSLGRIKDGIKSMGLCWLLSWLNELHNMFNSYAANCRSSALELDLLNSLKKVPFIPLSDGTYGSLDDGTIWFHTDFLSTGLDALLGNEAFPCLYSTLRIVNYALFSESSTDVNMVNNCTRVLQKIGVQQISAHELVRIHILPSISCASNSYDRLSDKSKTLMREYIIFIMLHLQSGCVECQVESEDIISELCSKALILTNHGYLPPVEVPIHFGKEYGNTFDANKLLSGLDYKWHEVDAIYLKHLTVESVPHGLMKWREFFLKLGVTDFVKVVAIEKSVAELSPTMQNQIICESDTNFISPKLVVKDWESHELLQILSLLSEDGNQERCKYLLEHLDILWDDHFDDKVFGCCSSNSGPKDLRFKSSLWHCISDFRWVSSTIDNDLYYPRELFYDCDDVRTILGCHAPYAVPKVKSVKLLKAIGFKIKVTLEDALSMLQSWRKMGATFTASLSQMSNFYTFIWKEMATCRQQVLDALKSESSIFLPCASIRNYEDIVVGVFLSPTEVYWNDTTGALDHMKIVEFPLETSSNTPSRTLCSIYPGLRDFFVNECGVHEAPSFRHYCQILQQLSGSSSALQAANAVFRVFLKWSDGLKHGALSSDDVAYLKECLLQSEFRVLPALQDKWISLHPSFGLVCWSDDDILKKMFKHSDNIEFLYFGELTENEKEVLQTEVSVLLQNLGIPALSKVVSREAIYNGPADCAFKTSVVAWVLPYAQRYIYNLHPERYNNFKQSGGGLHQLRIFVVEKLYYYHVIKRCNYSSRKPTQCDSLLQGHILFTTRESDTHSMFMELSRLFFDGAPELHMANFLHMITTMAESGSTEEQMEFFILNSQKMAKLPIEETVWSLSPALSSAENDELTRNALSTNINDQNKKKKPANLWPPVGWKNAPGINYGLRKRPMDIDQIGSNTARAETLAESSVQREAEVMTLSDVNEDVFIEDDGVVEPDLTTIPHLENQTDFSESVEVLTDPANIVVECIGPKDPYKQSRDKDSTPGAQEAIEVGRLGELLAFRYFAGIRKGETEVKWVNENEETGLPYDIVVGDEENREYIEVKASRYSLKDWFAISTREWQFATEKLDSYSIAYVRLCGQQIAKITVYKNPVKLCIQRKLQLSIRPGKGS